MAYNENPLLHLSIIPTKTASDFYIYNPSMFVAISDHGLT